MFINKGYLIFLVVFVMSLSFVSAATFVFNGTVYDINGNPLNNTNVSIALKNQSWADLGSNSTTTNASGWFNFNVTSDASYMYQLTLIHRNSTTNAVDYVGASLPAFPYQEFSQVSNVIFYLKEAGTINITAVNNSGRIPFAYQVKDTKLGYPISSCTSSSPIANQTICYVPKDRNYSIMIYPSQGDSSNHFVPVSFNWNNFSAASDYNIGALSNYNATKRQLNKQFNITESFARISGYLNGTALGIAGWDNLTIVPFLLEPSNMIFINYGTLPYNASAWNQQTDVYNFSTGFYNITIPYSATETVRYLLFAAAKNGSAYYGSYRNLTVSGNSEINFTAYGLLGTNSLINMSDSMGAGTISIYTKRQSFNLINSTGQLISSLNANIETKLDYSNYNSMLFTFIENINGAVGTFSLPMLNITGLKEMNIYSQTYAPKRVSQKTAAQTISNNNITMSQFDPGSIGDTIDDDEIDIYMYKSNSTCDVPNPDSACSITDTSDLDSFSPLKAIIGGGALSFRMGYGGILVHYVNVDMLASGPPDVSFDSSASTSTSSGFESAMRFGSLGPTIYDYVLISMPYTAGGGSTTGLDENSDVNMSIPFLYGEYANGSMNWETPIWNTTSNGTSGNALAGNNSHYSTRSSEWAYLMNQTNCTRNVSYFNLTTPCYIDTSNDRIWMRLPHFSGTKPNTQGGLITGSSTASSGGGGGGSSSNTQSITLSETAQEYKSLSAGATLKFSFEGGTHTLEVDKIAADRTSADFILSSDPIKFTLKVGEEKIIDLVTSISEQLYVKLNSINSARADVTVKRLSAKKPLEIIQLPKKTEETSSSQATQTESSLTEEAEQDTSPQEISMNQKQDKPILGFVAAVLIVVLGLGAYLYILKRRQ